MRLIPLTENTKVPLTGQDWHNLITDDEEIHKKWLETGFNLAMPLRENHRIVADFDDKNDARDFYRKHKEICSVIVETRKGAHFHFSGELPQSYKFQGGDYIKASGYCVYPPSKIDGFIYRLVTDGRLQPFPQELFPRKEVVSKHAIDLRQSTKIVKDVRAYIRRIPSVSGEHGHDSCFRVACILRDEGFSEMDALTEIEEWNRECARPPWSIRELSKKVKDAYRVVLKGQ
jgi:hypothetical protein